MPTVTRCMATLTAMTAFALSASGCGGCPEVIGDLEHHIAFHTEVTAVDYITLHSGDTWTAAEGDLASDLEQLFEGLAQNNPVYRVPPPPPANDGVIRAGQLMVPDFSVRFIDQHGCRYVLTLHRRSHGFVIRRVEEDGGSTPVTFGSVQDTWHTYIVMGIGGTLPD